MSERRGWKVEGVLVGLVGAATVALWFLIYDAAAGAPLRTPALLGAAMFQGLRDPAELEITTAGVVAYTVVHVAVFMAFGLGVAGLFAMAERDRRVLFWLFMLFCCFEVFAIALATVVWEVLAHAIPMWPFLVANALATATMLGVMFRHSRRSPREVLVAGE
jgi:hypothetical protein